ncbi:putative membrane protein [Marisediminicola sp. UYEF4]|uniref:SHOCT domain-containing protein n=1 Tax=Marisediminicola sp. UYEF4 TaxID=1756384 RepID=UPI003395B455
MMWGNGYGSGWMWLFGIMVFLGLILVIGAIVWAIANGNRSSGQAASGADRAGQPQGLGSSKAKQILDERYARGEIDAQEYRDRRDALSEGP